MNEMLELSLLASSEPLSDVNKVRHSDTIAQSEPLAHERDDDKARWTPEDECLIIREQPATRVYENAYGCVVIAQERRWVADDDPFIFIAPKICRL